MTSSYQNNGKIKCNRRKAVGQIGMKFCRLIDFIFQQDCVFLQILSP